MKLPLTAPEAGALRKLLRKHSESPELIEVRKKLDRVISRDGNGAKPVTVEYRATIKRGHSITNLDDTFTCAESIADRHDQLAGLCFANAARYFERHGIDTTRNGAKLSVRISGGGDST